MTACGGKATIFWTAPEWEASLPPRDSADEKPDKSRKEQERRIDEEIADSFPASDPPSYAGGPIAGGPRRPKSRKREG
jgi:hypothetical protein